MLTLTSSIFLFLLSIYSKSPSYQEEIYAASNLVSYMICLADYHLYHYLKYHQQRLDRALPLFPSTIMLPKGVNRLKLAIRLLYWGRRGKVHDWQWLQLQGNCHKMGSRGRKGEEVVVCGFCLGFFCLVGLGFFVCFFVVVVGEALM